jgi:hypothetical protein
MIILHPNVHFDSAVGVTTSYGLDSREFGVRVAVVTKIFSSPRHSDWFWASYPMDTGDAFPGSKAAGT